MKQETPVARPGILGVDVKERFSNRHRGSVEPRPMPIELVLEKEPFFIYAHYGKHKIKIGGISLEYKDILLPYNPWWNSLEKAFDRLPLFHRPIFTKIYREMKEIPQIISITGPRRVGKSTVIRQIIKNLITLEKVNPQDVIYYSMDDPALFLSEVHHDKFFESIMDHARKNPLENHLTYIFLDEIQRFERWELFLKKYYDLNYPVRFVVSGSASSPIFKKSRESLLGRIKDFHLLPFSFREFVLFQNRDNPLLIKKINHIYEKGKAVMGMLADRPGYAELETVPIPEIPSEMRKNIDAHFERFLLEGGFPEVWSLPDWEIKQSYLFDNQVEKVISEDLVLAVELRKPELLKKFFISLLEDPGREINFQQLSQELGINRATIEKYFPLLEMTDLIHHVEKFSKSVVKVRRGNIKVYLVDLALRNSILRIRSPEFITEDKIGFYIENLVFNALEKWEGTVSVNYYREKDREIDFVVHIGARKYLPIESKYKESIDDRELKNIENFCSHYKCPPGIVVTKQWDDFGSRSNGKIFYIPIQLFLLLFD